MNSRPDEIASLCRERGARGDWNPEDTQIGHVLDEQYRLLTPDSVELMARGGPVQDLVLTTTRHAGGFLDLI